jgi:serine/threonine protein kinase
VNSRAPLPGDTAYNENVLQPGDRVGDWVVEGPLGEGGMATVYRVHSALSDRVVGALKVMKPSLGTEARTRFVREAEALSALRHPGIVHVMGFSEDSVRGLLYLVMELAVGETLKARLERGPLTVAQALATCAPLAAALEYAHAGGIFHRDIKPANIVLCEDGTVRLVDFGIASAQHHETLTTTGHVGTVSYLPPEVFRGHSPDPEKLDVYSLGIVMYEALAGTRPFQVGEGLTPTAAAAAVGVQKLHQGSLDPGEEFPEELRHIVRRATDPEPSGRPTMYGMNIALQKVPRPAHEPGTGPVGPQRRRPATPPEERTTRVPDPPSGPARRGAPAPAAAVDISSTGDGRRRGRDRRRRRDDPKWWLGWAAAALMVLVTLTLLFRGGTQAPEIAPSASPASSRPAVRPESTPRRARPQPSPLIEPLPSRAAPATLSPIDLSPPPPPVLSPGTLVGSPRPAVSPRAEPSLEPSPPARVIVRPMILPTPTPPPGAVPVDEEELEPLPSPSPSPPGEPLD